MKVELKSLLAGIVIGGGALSVALAGQVSVPHTFVAGTTARASEVNANFAALAAESNNQDMRLASLEGAVGTAGAEQLLCQADPRTDGAPVNDLGKPVSTGFPFPLIRITTYSHRIASSVGSNALCIEPSAPEMVIETNLQKLNADGWRFAGGSGTYLFVR